MGYGIYKTVMALLVAAGAFTATVAVQTLATRNAHAHVPCCGGK